MAKRRIGTLKGKPIVEGDSNLISKNEVNIKELGNTGGGNGTEYSGVWDSDYLLINEMPTGGTSFVDLLIGMLPYAASMGISSLKLLKGGQGVREDYSDSFSDVYGARFLPTRDSGSAYGNLSFTQGLLRINDANTAALYYSMKSSIFGTHWQEEWVNCRSKLDIFDCVLDAFRVYIEGELKADPTASIPPEAMITKEQLIAAVSNYNMQIISGEEAKQLVEELHQQQEA